MLTVEKVDDKWFVTFEGHPIPRVLPFSTEREAWRWIDKHERRELWARSSTAEKRGAIYYDV